MSNVLPKVDPGKEIENVKKFISNIVETSNLDRIIVGLSLGIDSTTCLYMLSKIVPKEKIIVVHSYYSSPSPFLKDVTSELNIPDENIKVISIENTVNEAMRMLGIKKEEESSKLRIGNIIARVRMITLFDLAKKNKALVCGTENRSEYLLGYFTRYGDEASDFEPIRKLYKTQVYDLAEFLNVPKKIREQIPTAGLWEGQTDEKEFGFSYKEADQVLYLYFENKKSKEEIQSMGFQNAEKIIDFALKNKFKHNVPYFISD